MRKDIAFLAILGTLLFVPMLGRLHLFDWDEANFAEASREMIVRGDYMRVTIAYEPFWEKPPFFFWLQALSMKAFGVNEFAARLVDAVAGIFTMLMVYLIGSRVHGRRFGLLWALGFPASFLPHLFYKSGIIDPVFNFFIVLGLTLIAVGLRREETARRAAIFALAGVATGLAVLSKGPVAFLVTALVMGVYWATVRFRVFFRPAVDIPAYLLALFAVAFVFFGVETLSHGTWFVREFTRYQIRLLTTGDAGQGRPFWFHFVVILFGCFPASILAVRSFFTKREGGSGALMYDRLMMVLFWVVLVLFSVVKTKTVLYSSLAYFPVMYLAALHVDGLMAGRIAWTRGQSTLLGVFAGLIALAVIAFPIVLYHKDALLPFITDKHAVACLARPLSWTGFEWLIGVVYAVMLMGALVALVKKRFVAGMALLGGSTAFCLQVFMFAVAPKVESFEQAGPVAFYQQHADDNAYVRALYKSYIDLFYSRAQPGGDPASHSREWLLSGPIDKPAYLVGREHEERSYAGHGLVEIYRAYGFIYYRRDPAPAAPAAQKSAD